MKPLVSLTFDDGLVSQLRFALPILNRRGIKATFFLPVITKEYRISPPEWQIQADKGHEIGSHTMTHRKAASYVQDTLAKKYEISESKMQLEQMFHTSVVSFCYPYTDAPAALQDAVRLAQYTQARGGRGARTDKFLIPGDGANLFNVPCFHVGPYSAAEAPSWAEETHRRRAWLTLMFHGVGNPQDWDNITETQFEELLDAFDAKGVEFCTFSEGATRYRKC